MQGMFVTVELSTLQNSIDKIVLAEQSLEIDHIQTKKHRKKYWTAKGRLSSCEQFKSVFYRRLLLCKRN